MKKIIACIIAVILCVSSVAFAETEFSLRSGLEFGMSKQEVIQLEAEKGLELKDFTSSEVVDHYVSSATVAGIDNSSILYSYSSTGGLNSVIYTFPYIEQHRFVETDITDQKFGDSNISNSLYEKLCQLYGTPQSYIDYSFADDAIAYIKDRIEYDKETIQGWMVPSPYKKIGYVKTSIVSGDFITKEVNQWVVEIPDGYVCIEHLTYRYYAKQALRLPDVSVVYRGLEKEGVAISYTFLSEEQLNNMNSAVNDDL